MKKFIIVTLCLITICLHGKTQNVSITDTNFKAKLIALGVDKDFNNQISLIEASEVDSLNISNSQISSLTGIGEFTNLTYLNCDNNHLDSLILINNTSLTWLSCSRNGYDEFIGPDYSVWHPALYYLDVTNNTLLSYLDCSGDSLPNLNLSNNTALLQLYCEDSYLIELDISKNLDLKVVYCRFNQLTTLDVSKNQALTTLWCGTNQLTSLISENKLLCYLDCDHNQLTTLDVSKDTALAVLFCRSNNLTNLYSSNSALTELYCNSNSLTTIDVSKDTALNWFGCEYNPLTSIDVSKNINLTQLYCAHTPIASLDLSNNLALQDLYCSWTKLTTLDISMNRALGFLDIQVIPSLTKVCVWAIPFSPDECIVYDFFSPNVNYTTDCLSSIEDNAITNWNIYPNPSSNEINIVTSQTGLFSFELKNLQGQVMFTSNHIIYDNYIIDVSNLTNGIYVMSIQNNKLTQTYKVIIQH